MSAAGDAAASDHIEQDIAETLESANGNGNGRPDEDSDAKQDEDSDEDEPRLKYDKCTSRLSSIYRNGDSASAFVVAGNKLVIGTHNGNIHVLSLPNIQTLRTYKAHSATITSCSISPTPPPPTLVQRTDGGGVSLLSSLQSRPAAPTRQSTSASAKAPQSQPQITNTPDNAIYIATSSLDGHVCIFSLLDSKDVQLRNFARPVNAVALSPEFKTDRTYLSGGRAGSLILTKGGKAGVSSDANTNSAAAAASGWLGSIGLGSNTGKDSVLHQGEGNINAIKWSLSGKWVVWVNEEGFKIMRSHLRLGSEESENAWKRIGHISRPSTTQWDELTGVWKANLQWIDNKALEQDDLSEDGQTNGGAKTVTKAPEKLLIGWGDRAWVLHVSAGKQNTKKIGQVDIVRQLEFGDCIVSGLSLYTPSILAILVYRTRDDNDRAVPSAKVKQDGAKRGRGRKTSLAPQLRLVAVHDGEELDVDELPMSRFETLSAQDYQFTSLWIPPVIKEKTARDKGTLEGLWEVSGGYYAQKMLSSSASVLSRSSSGYEGAGQGSYSGNNAYDVTPTTSRRQLADAHSLLQDSGLKFFVQSPYDCVIAAKRQPSDHLEWLLQHKNYEQAWILIDKSPEVVDTSSPDALSVSSDRLESVQKQSAPDEAASTSSRRLQPSPASLEKQRIGELWLTQLTTSEKWTEAGEVASKVLQNGLRWEHWILTFAHAKRFDDITPHIPTTALDPSISSAAYEVILGHYVTAFPSKVCELLDVWEEGLFEPDAIVSAIQNRMSDDAVKHGSVDYKALLDALGRLYLMLADPREALSCYIRAQDSEQAFALIQQEKLADALGDDVPGFLTLKLSSEQLSTASLSDLDEASEQAVKILVEEAHKGTVPPDSVIKQLQSQGSRFRPLLYFYLRLLWKGVDKEDMPLVSRRMFHRSMNEGRAMVEDHADLAVEIFAEYNRDILAEFLEASEVYDYNKAAIICEQKHYIPELVIVLSRTGQTKKALEWIIGELGDASRAIAFVRQNPDLWDDLLEYGMDKPKFIKGLLTEVGTSIDPVKLIQRIPPNLEIPDLKAGVLSLVQAWELQLEVSRGVDRVLQSEVVAAMNTLREGQKRGLRFEVVHQSHDEIEISVVPPKDGTSHSQETAAARHEPKPGYCASCDQLFHEDEKQPLLGFPCGHVYHLSCLLEANGEEDSVFEQTMASLGYDDSDGSERLAYGGRSVGAKVAHAQLIRNVVDRGCGLCTGIEDI